MGDFSTSLLNEWILKHIWPFILEIWPVANIFEILCALRFCNKAWKELVDGSKDM
jgi:hypothetical protein